MTSAHAAVSIRPVLCLHARAGPIIDEDLSHDRPSPPTTGLITVEDGNYNVIFTKPLDYNDSPAPEIMLWFGNNVIYLPRN